MVNWVLFLGIFVFVWATLATLGFFVKVILEKKSGSFILQLLMYAVSVYLILLGLK